MIECPLTRFGSLDHRSELMAQRKRFFGKGQHGELLECVPIPVMVLNEQHQVVYANRAMLGLVGHPDFSGPEGFQTMEPFRCSHAKELREGREVGQYCACCGIANAILKTSENMGAIEECLIQINHAERQKVLDLRVSASPLQIGKDVFTTFSLVDVADEKRNEYLEQVFLKDILNTVSALRGLSVLLDSEVVEAETRRDFVERIKTLAERVTNEIAAHQQLVAAESNLLEPKFRTLRTTLLLERLAEEFGRLDILDGRKLRILGDSADVEFTSDPSLLENVLAHMLRNAIEASLPGGLVTVAAEVRGREVGFWVHNATYMPESIGLQVFKRSFSTKGIGRGLGTYMMKYLVEKYLGGTISFTSSEFEGTVFWAGFPMDARSQSSLQA